MNMKRTFKALLLGGLVYVSAIMDTNVSARNNPEAGKSSTLQDYQVKHVINNEENLSAYSCCFQNRLTSTHFYYDGAVKCIMSRYRR